MYQKSAAEHFSEAISRLSKQPHPLGRPVLTDPPCAPPPEAEPDESRGQAFTIAVSREAGSGGISVAREVGRRLNWPVYDQELLERLAVELHVDVSQVEDYDERRGSFLVDTLKAFSASASISEITYFRRLMRMLQALGSRGECIIVGRGSTFVLPRETTLRTRILATREDRLAFLMANQNLTAAEAAKFIETRDRERTRFIKDYFHKDVADPINYDLILNRSRFSVEECAELVIQALQRLQARKPVAKASR